MGKESPSLQVKTGFSVLFYTRVFLTNPAAAGFVKKTGSIVIKNFDVELIIYGLRPLFAY
ncbi:MAG: hypothetical protein A3A43_02980 [Candidatus Liptonbacteria bacterium RIFCSPLOWO2_01_FULL_56_20]|uniref:Uncharacterized protein n=1 Tax=Candidatus Liptonbacteria bacterium RIFCSPLOWO2_01_FULL_56_20 TaxID=1798652 RepID=A0A1G2CKQ6_9BACT|nr:MAG: hypothetical protein A2681_00110 [Candidatus Liptonbacteria bacterium RIFCSPHIGHO2_01_FULL_56_18b]OGZ01008.1 MAG: hypothetical protein A3A43_02980 [Candidatus Liptonbacteria bacterium RIFCSPLOWO2_01_FULL_56_20]